LQTNVKIETWPFPQFWQFFDPILVDDGTSEVDLDAVEEYCKNHHYLFEKVSAKRRPD
jgi:hypothetical protein